MGQDQKVVWVAVIRLLFHGCHHHGIGEGTFNT